MSQGYVAAGRLSHFPALPPGAAQGKCAECGEAIVLAAASQRRVAAGYIPLCEVCVTHALDKSCLLRIELPSAAEMAEGRKEEEN